MVAGPRNHLYRTPIRIRNSRLFRAGFLVLRPQIDHGGDLADQLDLEAVPIANSTSRESCREEEAQWHEAIC